MGASSKARTRNAAILILALCAALGAAFLVREYGPRGSDDAAAFFSEELRGASSTVIVDARSYRVEDGSVRSADGGALRSGDAHNALRVAYARLLAMRSSILNLEGTDPDLLSVSISRLERARDALAGFQKSERAAYAVSTALYPIEFLRALERTERLRQAFIASGRDSAWRAYAEARLEAIREGTRAAERFSRVIEESRYEVPTVATLSGKITRASVEESLAAIMRGFANAQEAADAEGACLDGAVSRCTPSTAPTPAAFETGSKDERLFREVLALYEQAFLGESSPAQRIVGLNNSSCLGGLQGTDYLIPQSAGTDFIFSYIYTGDIFIQPLKETVGGPVISWFIGERVRRLIYNPITFYTCPGSASDIARAKAVLLADRELGLTASREKNTVIYEGDALEALARAAEAADGEEAQKLRALLWAHHNRTAGLEDVVYDVAHGLETIIAMREKAIPTEVGAEFLFTTHSGFYGLLLGHNRTARSGQPSFEEPDPARSFLRTFQQYTAIKDGIPPEELVQDIKVYFTAHE